MSVADAASADDAVRPSARPVQTTGVVAAICPAGDYLRLRLNVHGVGARFEPGMFAALAVGGPRTSMLLRRSFSIYRVSQESATDDVELVFAVRGPGTAWLAELRPGDEVDVVAPLGRPFSLPEQPGACVLVGGGYGSAPLFSLARRLREAGRDVHVVLGAATESRLFGVAEAGEVATTVTVTTEDASLGVCGRVTDVLGPLVASRPAMVYACGPMAMLAAVARLAADQGLGSQCAVEESMACGVGVCMTCVLPVVGSDGVTRLVRSCVEGPVFSGELVRWDDVGTVPDDALGASVRSLS